MLLDYSHGRNLNMNKHDLLNPLLLRRNFLLYSNFFNSLHENIPSGSWSKTVTYIRDSFIDSSTVCFPIIYMRLCGSNLGTRYIVSLIKLFHISVAIQHFGETSGWTYCDSSGGRDDRLSVCHFAHLVCWFVKYGPRKTSSPEGATVC